MCRYPRNSLPTQLIVLAGLVLVACSEEPSGRLPSEDGAAAADGAAAGEAGARADAGADLAGVDAATASAARWLYVGETSGKITVFEIASDGKLTERGSASADSGLRWLAFHPTQPWLYAGAKSKVQAFSLDAQSGAPSAIGAQNVGANVTHLTVDRAGQHVFVASYGGNRIEALPLGVNGAPQAPIFSNAASGFCQNAHQVKVYRGNRWVYAPCLGSDHIAVLELDAGQGKVTVSTPVSTQSGAGPRHLAFHPQRDLVYLLNELDSTVNVYQLSPQSGQLSELQSISTIPSGQSGPSASSDIGISAAGDFLYAINREPLNNIAVFSIGGDGKLTVVDHTSTGGVHARSLAIDDARELLFVGNTKSMNLVTFAIDGASGKLTQLREQSFASQIYFVGLR